MKKRFFPRVLSCLLALIMLVGMVPAMSVSAEAYTTDDGIVYEIGNDEVTITDYTGTATELVIPLTIEGYYVTTIGDYAFAYDTNITSVSVPASVISIGVSAFERCSNLTGINLPDHVTSIGRYAFNGCSSLTSIQIPGGLTSTTSNNIFACCSSLSNVIISEGVTNINNSMFYFCESLGNITIPTSVTSIDSNAFNNCSNLKSIIIPSSVTNIGTYAFYKCPALTDVYFGGTQEQWNEIFVGDGNEYLTNATIHFAVESETEPVATDPTETTPTETTPDEADPVEKILIYFTDALNWGGIYLYYEYEGDSTAYPREMEWADTNSAGEDIYMQSIPSDADSIYFIGINGERTEYIYDFAENMGYYCTEETESGVYAVESYVYGSSEPATDPTEAPETEVTMPETVPTEPDFVPESGIGIGSGVFIDAQVGDKVRYTVEFSAQRLFENFEATLTYDSEYLELVALYDENGEELTDMYDIGRVMCPNLCNPFVNSTTQGVVRLFDINLDGNDFTESKVLLTMEFVVKSTFYSEIDLTIDEMTILGGDEDYFTDGEAVITEGVNITESIEITEKAPEPTEPEETKVYSVVFLDYDGKFIEVQIVKEGEAATAPEAPSRKGYNFSGWDTEFENVTSNIIVKATYTKIPTPPVQTPTTGTLKIEVSGGKGFSISIGGGAFRTQGASYMNSQAPIGETVTVKADTLSDATFAGWINPNTGIVVSSDLSYTFTASGNDFFKAMYIVKVEGVQLVTFKNDKANRILDSQYYAQDEAIQFPVAPTQVGFDFAGWNMTEAEIKSAIANGEDVTVFANWTVQIVPVQVTVNGGTGSGTYNANNAVTVTANEAPEGQKFAYWTDAQGNIKSYSTEYKFYPAADTTVTAVFVAEDDVIDYQILVNVDSIDTTTIADKNVFYYSWYCPDSYTFVDAGVVAVNKDNYNEATFVAGSSDSNVYDRGPSGANIKPVNTYSWTKSNITSGQTWMAMAYVQYKDASGSIITVYSDVIEATKD